MTTTVRAKRNDVRGFGSGGMEDGHSIREAVLETGITLPS